MPAAWLPQMPSAETSCSSGVRVSRPRRQRRGEGAAERSRVEAAVVQPAAPHRGQPAADLERGDEGDQRLLARRAAGLAGRHDGRHGLRAGMIDRADMGVVEIEPMGEHAIDEGGRSRRQRRAAADRQRLPAAAELARALQDGLAEIAAGRGQRDAEHVEQMLLRQRHHLRRHVVERQRQAEAGEEPRLGGRGRHGRGGRCLLDRGHASLSGCGRRAGYGGARPRTIHLWRCAHNGGR